MKRFGSRFLPVLALLALLLCAMDLSAADELVRPTEIKSMRQAVYDRDTYNKLADLWEKYNEKYPSEYAYANWMYAARYAGWDNYSELLNDGLRIYPANPTLLYLKGIEPGDPGDSENRKNLERSAALAPDYMDPWFALVPIYMNLRDNERLELALRNILESSIITDEVMDYNYNILSSLAKNAILITNGDNDTYPGWILQNVLGVRPDIDIINRSLLNTDWYPVYVLEQGAPQFINRAELDKMRKEIADGLKMNPNLRIGGAYSDTLIAMIISSAERSGRPVYFANTLYFTDRLREIAENGQNLGLYLLVTPEDGKYGKALAGAYRDWIDDYRVSGLRSWRLRYSPPTDAGRSLVSNYGQAIAKDLDSLKKYAPGLRRELFQWYIDNVEPVLSEKLRGNMAQIWCDHTDVTEIKSWCKKQGIK